MIMDSIKENDAQEADLAERLVTSGMAALFYQAVIEERLALRDTQEKGEGIQQRRKIHAAAKARREALQDAARALLATPQDRNGWEVVQALHDTFEAYEQDAEARQAGLMRASRIRRMAL